MEAQASPPEDNWPSEWRVGGFNYSIDSAIGALRYLARHDRPTGGEQRFNACHLLQIADELGVTQKEMLAPAVLAVAAMQRELIAWRVLHQEQIFQDGVGIVAKT